jgi:hypothetical protein
MPVLGEIRPMPIYVDIPQPPSASSADAPDYENLTPVAKIIVDKVWPMMHSSSYNVDLATLIQGVSILLDELYFYVGEGPNGEVGWSALVDLARAPTKGLPWLSQLAGVVLAAQGSRSDATYDTESRAAIATTSGQRRGRPSAMIAAAQASLTGDKRVILRERFGGAYLAEIITFTSETPDPVRTEADIRAQKPGGIILTYTRLTGEDYEILYSNNLDYDHVKTTYATYEGVLVDAPGT